MEFLAGNGIVSQILLHHNDSSSFNHLVSVNVRVDVSQNNLSRQQVFFIFIQMIGKKIVSTSYSLHLCLFDDPLLLELLDYAVIFFFWDDFLFRLIVWFVDD